MYDINLVPRRIRINLKVVDNHWLWIGGSSDLSRKDQRGRMRWYGEKIYVHRLVFHLLTGFDLNSELQVNHKIECPYSSCCNPDCLYSGTQTENCQDMTVLGSHFWTKEHVCPQCGNEYDSKDKYGQLRCSKCSIKRSMKSIRKKKNKEKLIAYFNSLPSNILVNSFENEKKND